jgi:hypothetical protein
MRIAVTLVAFALFACGGSGGGGGGPTEAPIRLTSSGLSSASIAIPSGGCVHFFNNDSVNHQISSTSCPDLDTPVLAPGGDSLRPQMTGPVSCTFDDALNPSSAAFSGSVTVNSPSSGGGGSGY